LNYAAWLDGLIACAAFGVQELQNFLESFGVGGVAQEGAFTVNAHEIFIFQFVEVMRKSGIGNVQFRLQFADDQAAGVGGQEQLHDAEAWLGAHGGEHVSEFGDLVGVLCNGGRHISIIAEIRRLVKRDFFGLVDLTMAKLSRVLCEECPG
jgi:hypothetical protein